MPKTLKPKSEPKSNDSTLSNEPKLESIVQAEVRLAYAAKSNGTVKLWRNNSGACVDKTGRTVRYGLGNDSARINAVIKSSDLLGWTTVVITPEMVGQSVAVFTSVECKREGWKYNPNDEREAAQKRWIDEVTRAGGRARFICDAKDV